MTTIISGALCALCAGILPIEVLSELTSVGTLFAFVLVCLGVAVLRYKRPNIHRKFKVPFGPWLIPLLGAACSFGLICTSTINTIYRLLVWMAVGWSIYFSWGLENSRLDKEAHPLNDDEINAVSETLEEQRLHDLEPVQEEEASEVEMVTKR